MERFRINRKIIVLICFVVFSILSLTSCGVGKATVTFDTTGGTKVDAVQISNGELLQLPKVPVKEGWEFVEWKLPDGKVWDFEKDIVTEDITLIATWRCKHKYAHACDTTCDTVGCGYIRITEHVFEHDCDTTCNTVGCGYKRTVTHEFTNDCDKDCNNPKCNYVRVASHVYDHDCDGICNVVGCGQTRPIEHKFDHACDTTCNVTGCGYERVTSHLFDDECDADCNVSGCGAVIEPKHNYAHSLDKDCDNPNCSETRTIGKQAVLLIGQSNMVGIGDVTTVEPVLDPRLTMMREDKWVSFCEPLHTNTSRAGIGLGGSFAKAFVETFDCELGVIPAAEGATTLEMWAVGGRLYNEAVRLCNAKHSQL